MFKFHTQNSIVKSLLKKKIIGDIKFFESKFLYPKPLKNNIRLKPKLFGGVYHDSIGYPVNALHLFIEDKIKKYEVSYTFDKFYKVDDCINLQIEFTNKTIANLTAGFGFEYESYYKIYGTKGIIKVEKPFSINANIANKIYINKNNKLEIIKMKPEDQFLLMIEYFSNLILKNKYSFFEKNILSKNEKIQKFIFKINNNFFGT